MANTWLEFRFHILGAGPEDRAYIPSDRQIRTAEEQIVSLQAKLDDEVDPRTQGVLTRSIEQAKRGLEQAQSLVKDYREVATEKVYLVREPTFGEFIEAEERAKEWVDGTPRIDRSKFLRSILHERVQYGGNILKPSEINELPVWEGTELGQFVEALCYPDSNRIPFWFSPSAT